MKDDSKTNTPVDGILSQRQLTPIEEEMLGRVVDCKIELAEGHAEWPTKSSPRLVQKIFGSTWETMLPKYRVISLLWAEACVEDRQHGA